VPVARQLKVALFSAIWIVSACVSVAPPAPTASSIAVPTDSGVPPTTQPTTPLTTSEPSVEAPSLAPEPTAETPTEPAEATATARPTRTQPPQPPTALPNLRIGKFEADQLPVVVDATATLTADITNFADTASGPFIVEFVSVQAGQEDLVLDTQTFDSGLAAGAATKATVSITPNEPVGLSVIARVDPVDQIEETDESDNEKLLEIIVEQNQINLAVPSDGLTVTSAGDAAAPTAYLFTLRLTNSGQSTMTGPMSVKYFGYESAGGYVEWGTFDFDVDLAPGAEFNQQVGWSVEPGTYRAYALADSGETWTETNEEDNEAILDFTAP